MAGSSYGSARDRIERVCAAGLDPRTLRLRLLDELRRTVGFDAYAWLLTDPETCVGSAPLADVPCLPELPRLIRLKYLTAMNRWTALPGDGVATLVMATGGDLSRSRLWRELLTDHGVRDVASMVFRDRYGCWAFLDLWRVGAAGMAFTEDETRFLADVTAAVTSALRSSQAATFTARTPDAGDRQGPVVLLLSSELGLLGSTPETDAYLRTLLPPDADSPPIPAGAYNVAAQLLAVEEGIDAHPPWARVHLSAGRWLSLRAARIDEGPPQQGVITVSIEEASAQERLTLFSLAAGLTGRETELLQHLVAGGDTRELAHRMSVSPHTVQDHLKAVFAKTATHSRRDLVARALGS